MKATGFALATMVMISAATIPSGTAKAQEALFDSATLSSACAADSNDCVTAATAAIDKLQAIGLSPEPLNSQIGAIAAVIVEAAKSAANPVQIAAARALELVAAASSDPAQRLAISKVAALVASGNGGQIDTSNPIAASPA